MGLFDSIAGGVLGLGGTLLSGAGANQAKNAVTAAANLPGVDFNTIYNQSLGASSAALPQAAALTGQENTTNATQFNAMMNQLFPGYSQIQSQRSNNIENLLSGAIPQDVQSAIARADAAKALGGGFSGSGAQQNLTARDLGLTSLDLQNMGNQQAAGFISGPNPGFTGVNSQLTINPSQALQTRSGERAAQQQLLAGAGAMPGWTGALGAGLQSLGGTIMGGGLNLGGTGSNSSWNPPSSLGGGIV